jgi:flavin reductase (DIM6/NTAB) family NADH-FMN oxidoreductase RutF
LRRVLGQYPTGVCVVTATPPEGSRAGFVVGSFTSVSLDPPLVAFFPDRGSTSWPRIRAAGRFCVNILSADQEDVCRRFASKAPDKFESLSVRESPLGSPVLSDVVAWIDCELERIDKAGDHYFVLGRVCELEIETAGLPLLFFQGGYGRFAPRSLAAPNQGGLLTSQLRQVDLIRGGMETLADQTAGRCIATALVDGEIVVTASAGTSDASSTGSLVGQRLPFAPPTGATFAAWMAPDEIEAWLAKIADPARRELQRQKLVLVRHRGYSVGLLNEAQRRFAAAIERMAHEPAAVSSDELTGLIPDLSYDPVELTMEAKRDIRVITAPAFDDDRHVAVAFTLYGFPNPGSNGGIGAYIEGTVQAARHATGKLARHVAVLA